MPYRPDIDGLRAGAIVAVVAFRVPVAVPSGLNRVDGVLRDAASRSCRGRCPTLPHSGSPGPRVPTLPNGSQHQAKRRPPQHCPDATTPRLVRHDGELLTRGSGVADEIASLRRHAGDERRRLPQYIGRLGIGLAQAANEVLGARGLTGHLQVGCAASEEVGRRREGDGPFAANGETRRRLSLSAPTPSGQVSRRSRRKATSPAPRSTEQSARCRVGAAALARPDAAALA